jgi:hypothetical protein
MNTNPSSPTELAHPANQSHLSAEEIAKAQARHNHKHPTGAKAEQAQAKAKATGKK